MQMATPATRRKIQNIEHVLRKVNREVISPIIPTLEMDDILPVMAVVAKLRGIYLKELLQTANTAQGGVPSEEQMLRLKGCREAFEEILAGAQALEVVIEREYLDINF